MALPFFIPFKDCPDRATHHRSNLIVLSELGCGLAEQIDSTVDRIGLADNLKGTVSGARFVVEAVSENLFREMEAYCSPITILATNSSVLSVSKIAAGTKAKERVVGTHLWNPPYLIPLVEVVGGPDTLEEVKAYTCNLLKSMGMHPVLAKKRCAGSCGKSTPARSLPRSHRHRRTGYCRS
ncbi:MAG: 3-hydroxyacyl-CoA dehydrogenase NAD-binding domain-containing protein [Pseudomonadota bacterium]